MATPKRSVHQIAVLKPWKIERWQDVTSATDDIRSQYQNLQSRELIVVAAAILDIGLVELIRKRLSGTPAEAEAFLGVRKESYAPGATFAARIQLARLLGIFQESVCDSLIDIKEIRNKMAHRIRVALTAHDVYPTIQRIHQRQVAFLGPALSPGEHTLEQTEESARNIILSELGLMHLVVHRVSERIQPIGQAW